MRKLPSVCYSSLSDGVARAAVVFPDWTQKDRVMLASTPISSRMMAVALAGLMGITRIHHFGSAFTLPDASLAVFFLAGCLVRNPWYLLALLIEAGVLDYWAIGVGGVSDWCVTPAYLFLIPTYGTMWLGGRWAARFQVWSLRSLVLWAASLIVSCSLAFLVSNGSFYLFSDRFEGVYVGDYFGRISGYYWFYLGAAVLYSLLACGAVAIVRRVSRETMTALVTRS